MNNNNDSSGGYRVPPDVLTDTVNWMEQTSNWPWWRRLWYRVRNGQWPPAVVIRRLRPRDTAGPQDA